MARFRNACSASKLRSERARSRPRTCRTARALPRCRRCARSACPLALPETARPEASAGAQTGHSMRKIADLIQAVPRRHLYRDAFLDRRNGHADVKGVLCRARQRDLVANRRLRRAPPSRPVQREAAQTPAESAAPIRYRQTSARLFPGRHGRIQPRQQLLAQAIEAAVGKHQDHIARPRLGGQGNRRWRRPMQIPPPAGRRRERAPARVPARAAPRPKAVARD